MIRFIKVSVGNSLILSLSIQLTNVMFWKGFKLGGIMISFLGLFQWGFLIDSYSSRFIIFCRSIGVLVLIYSNYYILNREVGLFNLTIFSFITCILLLTCSRNLLTMFVGWEGVGIISFVLIGWFIRRHRAISASSSAFLYNRFADYFFFILLLWEMTGSQGLFYVQRSELPIWGIRSLRGISYIVVLSVWMATAGKSAQFFFHPWLTLAMEGPTPVRSLLHSRTIVVAGVYLLLKLHPLIVHLNISLLNGLILSTRMVTILFTSIWALNQRDIKKIIALSTTSQLRFMIIVCCLGLYDLAYLHMLLHGFFKALLFLGRGVLIHNNITHSQDLHKINLPPLRESSSFRLIFLVGVLGLMGVPFIGAFSRKHIILDAGLTVGSILLRDSLLPASSFLFRASVVGLFLSAIITVGYSSKLLIAIIASSAFAITSGAYSRSVRAILPITLLSSLSIILGNLLGNTIKTRTRSVCSQEDFLYSTFIVIILCGLGLYLFTGQRAYLFLLNKTSKFVIWKVLYMEKLLKKILFLLTEKSILKNGLKRFIPPLGANKWLANLSKNSYNLNLVTLVNMNDLLISRLITGFFGFMVYRLN